MQGDKTVTREIHKAASCPSQIGLSAPANNKTFSKKTLLQFNTYSSKNVMSNLFLLR